MYSGQYRSIERPLGSAWTGDGLLSKWSLTLLLSSNPEHSVVVAADGGVTAERSVIDALEGGVTAECSVVDALEGGVTAECSVVDAADEGVTTGHFSVVDALEVIFSGLTLPCCVTWRM